PLIGLANCAYVADVLRDAPGAFDYVEVSFEQLRHDPTALDLRNLIPLILHCASLSLAGFVPPTPETVAGVRRAVGATGTPWVGEHLAFLTAEPIEDGRAGQAPWNYDIGYTVAPSLNDETLERLIASLAAMTDAVGVPLIVENPPSYFPMPDSTYSQPEFLSELCERCDTGLLCDLTHLHVSATNLGFDAMAAVRTLPAERIVEIHLSGASEQEGFTWDDHAVVPPEPVFDLLSAICERARPRAVTLEFNWRSQFPLPTLLDVLSRTRDTIARAQGVPLAVR
ncbi:MAG: DUF692 family protein, partial [Actinomycetota bacterium]|nr:DUF692 family protein [Actinomycetota bacterium]